MVLIVVSFSSFSPYLLSLGLLFCIENRVLDFRGKPKASFTFNIIYVSECLFKSGLLIIGYLLFGGLEVFLKSFYSKIIDFLVSKMLYFFLHNPDYSLLLYADDVVNNDLLGC